MDHSTGGREKLSLSCHQCKSRKNFNSLVYCTSHMLASVCKKKYCTNCLKKFYDIEVMAQEKPTWVCPACNRFCKCALCKRKSKDRPAEPAVQITAPQYQQHQPPITNDQHGHVHALPLDHGLGYPPQPGFENFMPMMPGHYDPNVDHNHAYHDPAPHVFAQHDCHHHAPSFDAGMQMHDDNIANHNNQLGQNQLQHQNIHHINLNPHQTSQNGTFSSFTNTFDTRGLSSAPSSPLITVALPIAHNPQLLPKPLQIDAVAVTNNKSGHNHGQLLALDLSSPAFSASAQGNFSQFPHPQSPQQQWTYDKYYGTLVPKKRNDLNFTNLPGNHPNAQFDHQNQNAPTSDGASNNPTPLDNAQQSTSFQSQQAFPPVSTSALIPSASNHPNNPSSATNRGTKRKHPLSPHQNTHSNLDPSQPHNRPNTGSDSPPLNPASYSPNFSSTHLAHQSEHIRSLRELREMGLGPQNLQNLQNPLVQLDPLQPIHALQILSAQSGSAVPSTTPSASISALPLATNIMQRVSSSTSASQSGQIHGLHGHTGSLNNTPNHTSTPRPMPPTSTALFFTSSLLAPSPNFPVNQPHQHVQANTAMLPPPAHQQHSPTVPLSMSPRQQHPSLLVSNSAHSSLRYNFKSLLQSVTHLGPNPQSTVIALLSSLLTSLDTSESTAIPTSTIPAPMDSENPQKVTKSQSTSTSPVPGQSHRINMPMSDLPQQTNQAEAQNPSVPSTTTETSSNSTVSHVSPISSTSSVSTSPNIPLVEPQFVLEYLKSMLLNEHSNLSNHEAQLQGQLDQQHEFHHISTNNDIEVAQEGRGNDAVSPHSIENSPNNTANAQIVPNKDLVELSGLVHTNNSTTTSTQRPSSNTSSTTSSFSATNPLHPSTRPQSSHIGPLTITLISPASNALNTPNTPHALTNLNLSVSIASRPSSSATHTSSFQFDPKIPRQSLVLFTIYEFLSIQANADHAIHLFSQHPLNLFDALTKLAEFASIQLLGEEQHQLLAAQKKSAPIRYSLPNILGHADFVPSAHNTQGQGISSEDGNQSSTRGQTVPHPIFAQLSTPSTTPQQSVIMIPLTSSTPRQSHGKTTATTATGQNPPLPPTSMSRVNSASSHHQLPQNRRSSSNHSGIVVPIITSVSLTPKEVLFHMKSNKKTFNFYKCFTSFFTPRVIADVIRYLYHHSQMRHFYSHQQAHTVNHHHPHHQHQSLLNPRTFHPSPILLSTHQIIPPQLSDLRIARVPAQPTNSLALLTAQNRIRANNLDANIGSLNHMSNAMTSSARPHNHPQQASPTHLAAVLATTTAHSIATTNGRVTNNLNQNHPSLSNTFAMYTNPSPVLVPLTTTANVAPLTSLNAGGNININSLLHSSVGGPKNTTNANSVVGIQLQPPPQTSMPTVTMPPLPGLNTINAGIDGDEIDHENGHLTPPQILSVNPSNSNHQPASAPNDTLAQLGDWLQLSPQTLPQEPIPQLPPLSADALKLNQ